MGSETTKEIFKQQKEEQLQLLRKQIETPFSNKEKFKVFPIEASLGKTQTLIHTIRDIRHWNPHLKFLVVTKFMEEGAIIEKQIPSAIAYNSNHHKDILEEDLCKYNVLVITHALYLKLCKNAVRRKHYIKDRHTMIIDEELNILRMSSLDDRAIDQMAKILHELNIRLSSEEYYCDVNLQETYYAIIEKLNVEKNKYNKKQMEFFYCEDLDIEKRIDMMIKLVEDCPIAKEYLEFLEDKHDIVTNREKIISQLDMLRKFYNNKRVIVCSRTLYTYDDRDKYFLLNNNILLDASASVNKLYDIAPLFDVKHVDRIVRHEKSTIHWAKLNTSGYALKHTPDLENNLFNSMICELKENDKVLVLATEYYLKRYRKMLISCQENLMENNIIVDMENFQGMRGKNQWKDYNKCFVLHTPSLGLPYYVFEYMMYGIELPELTHIDLKTGRIGHNYGFVKNAVLEELRKTDIVSTIYQGIKRINRDNKVSADIYIANNNEEIVSKVIDQLKGVKVTDWELVEELVKKKRKKRKQESYNNSQRTEIANSNRDDISHKILDYFSELPDGEHKKIDVRKAVGILNRKIFKEYYDFMINNYKEPYEQLCIKWMITGKKFTKGIKFQ
jgi:hypothetical protein